MHNSLLDRFTMELKSDGRDIAFIASPSMGLDSVLKSLSELHSVITVNHTLIEDYWVREYAGRSRHKHFVLHAAVIKTILDSHLFKAEIAEQELFRTNIRSYFTAPNAPSFNREEPIFIVLKDLERLPSELGRLVCDELKSFYDIKCETPEICMLRFIVTGMIDFEALYQVANNAGVSPATNFKKYYPHEFILDSINLSYYLEAQLDFMSLPKPLRQLVLTWSGGFTHYAYSFATWLIDLYNHNTNLTLTEVLQEFHNSIRDHQRLSVFSSCEDAWSHLKGDKALIEILRIAISAGCVRGYSAQTTTLFKLGLLIRDYPKDQYRTPNHLIHLFIRQRLSELGSVLPLNESGALGIPSLNQRAYALIYEIENCTRTFIGDMLYLEYRNDWADKGLKHVHKNNRSILEEARIRKEEAHNSPYHEGHGLDSILMYLDFTDLGLVLQQNSGIFARNGRASLSEKLPQFLEEINYYRRTIAHSRPVTQEKLSFLEDRWMTIQNTMRQYLESLVRK